MEEWARWAFLKPYNSGYPSITTLGKMLKDMPSAKCTLCDGSGKLSGRKWHIQGFITCPQCDEKGRIRVQDISLKINPAFIHTTRHYCHIPRIQFNHLAYQVDIVIRNRLTSRQQQIAAIEYQEPGTAWKKARLLNINPSVYSRHLQRIHHNVEKFFRTA